MHALSAAHLLMVLARGILAKRKNNHAIREAPAKLRHLQADLQQHQHDDASSARLLYVALPSEYRFYKYTITM